MTGEENLHMIGRLGDGWTPSYSYAPPNQIPKMEQTLEQSISEQDERAMKFEETIPSFRIALEREKED